MKPRKTGPYPTSPIIRRPKVRWPNGARVAVWIIPNIEFFALDEPISTPKVPDVGGFAVRDYGNRIGDVVLRIECHDGSCLVAADQGMTTLVCGIEEPKSCDLR